MFENCVEPVESKLLPYCGHPVCLLMKDGTRKLGRMTACRKGSVILNGDAQGEQAATAATRVSRRRSGKTRSRFSKPKSASSSRLPPQETTWEGLSFAPLSLEPLAFIAAQKDQIPLQKIETVLIL